MKQSCVCVCACVCVCVCVSVYLCVCVHLVCICSTIDAVLIPNRVCLRFLLAVRSIMRPPGDLSCRSTFPSRVYRGYRRPHLFLFGRDIFARYTLTRCPCSRLGKVTNKSVWPCFKYCPPWGFYLYFIFFSPESGPSSCPCPIPDRKRSIICLSHRLYLGMIILPLNLFLCHLSLMLL